MLGRDDFTVTAGSLDSIVWLNASQFSMSGDAAVPTSFSADKYAVFFNQTSLITPRDHYARASVTVTGTTDGTGLGVIVRFASPLGQNTWYRIVVNKAVTNNITVAKYHPEPTLAQMAQFTSAWVDGDVLMARVSGDADRTAIEVFQNDVFVGRTTDTAGDMYAASGNVFTGIVSVATITSGSIGFFEFGSLFSFVGKSGSDELIRSARFKF